MTNSIGGKILETANAAVTNEMAGKKWYTSKMVWVNIITLVAAGSQAIFGVAFPPAEYQMLVLGGVNLVLRGVTHEKIIW